MVVEIAKTAPGKVQLVKAAVAPRNGPPRNGRFSFLTGFFCKHPWPEEPPRLRWVHTYRYRRDEYTRSEDAIDVEGKRYVRYAIVDQISVDDSYFCSICRMYVRRTFHTDWGSHARPRRLDEQYVALRG